MHYDVAWVLGAPWTYFFAGVFVAVEQNEVYHAIGKQLHIDGGTEEDKMRVIRLQVRAVL